MINLFRRREVFISHSSINRNIAEQLCAFMTALGVSNNRIFCSSIVGQGVDNGEKLNRRIANSIKKSKVLIYLISAEFLDSPYCVEELGVGWYLSENNILKSYYLVLPDVFNISDIQGFVNSKIDKFSYLNCHEDLNLFAKNLCKELGLQVPDVPSLANAKNVFYSTVEPMFKALVDKKNQFDQEKKDIESTAAWLKAENKQLQETVQHLNDMVLQERIQYKANLLEKEYHTIENDFHHFGGQTGITKQKFDEEGESFWFSMVSRYLAIRRELQELGCPRLYHENIEILIATIYSAHGDLEDAYEHLKIFFQFVRSTIYPSVFKNIVFDTEKAEFYTELSENTSALIQIRNSIIRKIKDLLLAS